MQKGALNSEMNGSRMVEQRIGITLRQMGCPQCVCVVFGCAQHKLRVGVTMRAPGWGVGWIRTKRQLHTKQNGRSQGRAIKTSGSWCFGRKLGNETVRAGSNSRK